VLHAKLHELTTGGESSLAAADNHRLDVLHRSCSLGALLGVCYAQQWTIWLQRHAWWLLLTMTVLLAVIGVWPVILGIKEDASVPLGITGMTASQLEASSVQGYRLLDFEVRSGGVALIVIGTLLGAVVLGAFRQGLPWAWWVMWVLPVWAASVFVLILSIGVAPGQAPPTPMISGPIFAVLSAALLLVSAPRFFGHQPTQNT
jgi:hypothetical protein